MAWNTAQYNRGVADALSTAARTSIVDLIFQFTKVESTGEYRVGWERGIRRHLIDVGERVRCAEFVLMTTANQSLWRYVMEQVKAETMRWVVDPHSRNAVGLKSSYSRGNDVMMVVYLEEGDFEESLRLVELADEWQALQDLNK